MNSTKSYAKVLILENDGDIFINTACDLF